MLLLIGSKRQRMKFFNISRVVWFVRYINRSRSSASLTVPYRCNDMLAAPFTPARPFI